MKGLFYVRLSKTLIVLIVLAGAGAAWWMTRPSPSASPQAAKSNPVPVVTAEAARRDLAVHLQGLATVQAFNTVTIRAQVDGQLTRIAFREGQEVHVGDLLAEIDPRGYQAALDQAVARKAQDEAQLTNARNDLQRYRGLVAQNYVARQQLDVTEALVKQLEAAVLGDRASIEAAQVTLGYTAIRSPLEGRAGIRLTDVGNIVKASDSAGIVVVTQMRPISLLFTLPEENLPRIVEAMRAGPLAVTALSRDGKEPLDQGVLETLDNQIDTTTGTIRLKATMPNRLGRLWPGQFVNAQLDVETLRGAVVIPAAAVQRGPQGAFVYVIGADDMAEIRTVGAGAISEGQAVIDSGLKEGERVVTEGQYRLQQGSKVAPRT